MSDNQEIEYTGRYKYTSRLGGYEHALTVGEVYDGQEVPGIFDNSPYLIVYKDGQEIAAAHLSRFTKVEGEA